ncbi:phosphatase PAP2 family protein [Streptomyces sp. MST-110588]|uniref:phosphatase PAP2 family protein n=1 Tax=Streptomyces sp. MST-110588 TaxID=2833628 RepID=UPI001F5D03AC|nr:phosphatase PAP2 family protein [Streptomyces sp. MST-110588]UNO41868.1 phosphatase PAP2 family protein [Streptomyces sp. MST-110588]
MHTAVRRIAAVSGGRPRWWTELPLTALLYAAYSAGRLLARGDTGTATGNGHAIVRLEELLRLDPERALNRLFTAHASLGVPADYVYASLHYLVTPAVLIWLWHRHAAGYRLMRTWLLISTLIGLVGFTLLPTAPPRLLGADDGFADTMARFSSYGWWGQDASAPRGLGGMTNQYAAMPSLHVGWALWCGAALWLYGASRLTRAAAVAYPLLVALVVMGTANHYLLDALAGAAVMVAGRLLAQPALRLADGVRARVRTGQVRTRTRQQGPAGSAGPGEPNPPNRLTDTAPAHSVTGVAHAPDANVSGGCETSAGERIPRQSTCRGGPGAGPVAADARPVAARATAAAADGGAAPAPR